MPEWSAREIFVDSNFILVHESLRHPSTSPKVIVCSGTLLILTHVTTFVVPGNLTSMEHTLYNANFTNAYLSHTQALFVG